MNPSPTPTAIAPRIQTVRYLSRKSIDRGSPQLSQSQFGPWSWASTLLIADLRLSSGNGRRNEELAHVVVVIPVTDELVTVVFR